MRFYKDLQNDIRGVREKLCLYLTAALPTQGKQMTMERVLPTGLCVGCNHCSAETFWLQLHLL
jgi:hypothetical protein